MGESADICDVAKLSISGRGNDDNFEIFEEIIDLESPQEKTRWSDIFEKVISCIENQLLNSRRLLCVCTDEAPTMDGRIAGTAASLVRSLVVLF